MQAFPLEEGGSSSDPSSSLLMVMTDLGDFFWRGAGVLVCWMVGGGYVDTMLSSKSDTIGPRCQLVHESEA